MTPEEHHSGLQNEFSIWAGNVSASLNVTAFWVLFLWTIKDWSFPAFLSIQFGILIAYSTLAFAVWKDWKGYTVVNWILGKVPSLLVTGVFVFLALYMLFIEALWAKFAVKNILLVNNENTLWTLLTLLILFVAVIFYVFAGGMRAVLQTDAVFVTVASALILYVISSIDYDAWLFGSNNIQSSTSAIGDFKNFDIGSLSFLHIIYYISACLYVAVMYLLMPDNWHRNVTLKYQRKRIRLFNIFLSFIGVSALLQFAYFISAKSRDAYDFSVLFEHSAEKDYNFDTVINVFSGYFGEFHIVAVLLLVLISAFTSIDSFIISIVYSVSKNASLGDMEKEKNNYKTYLLYFFKVSLAIAFLVLIFPVDLADELSLIGVSCQIFFMASLLLARAFGKLYVIENFWYWVSFVFLFGVLYLTNNYFNMNVYYPLIGLVTGIANFVLFSSGVPKKLRGA